MRWVQGHVWRSGSKAWRDQESSVAQREENGQGDWGAVTHWLGMEKWQGPTRPVMYVSMHMHAHILTHSHCLYKLTHACPPLNMPHIHTFTHPLTHLFTYTHAHSCTQSYTHTHTSCTYSYTLKHTCMHTPTAYPCTYNYVSHTHRCIHTLTSTHTLTSIYISYRKHSLGLLASLEKKNLLYQKEEKRKKAREYLLEPRDRV